MGSLQKISMSNPVLFYDGVCNLCNGFVQLVLRYDRQRIIKFCPLQEEIASNIRQSIDVNQDMSSAALLWRGKLSTNSDVLFDLVNILGGYWKLINVLKIFPRPLRDWVYAIIANNRYRFFGRTESCQLPSEGWQDRFLFTANE